MPEDDVNIIRGTCRYCGQTQIVSFSASQEEADERAAQKCDCVGATRERNRQRRVEQAGKNIDRIFGAGAAEYGQRTVGGRILDYLREAAELMAGDVCAGDIISDIRITVPDVCVAILSATSKGNVKISRRETRVRSLES